MPRSRIIEIEELRARLREAEETLAAIRNGEVDSLIVAGPNGDHVFSLRGAEQPYRVIVEQMQEGAVTLDPGGTVLYANRRFAEMMKARLEKVIGSPIYSFIRGEDQPGFIEFLRGVDSRKTRYSLIAADGSLIPVQLAFNRLPIDELDAVCVVVTDLTEQEEKRELATALQDLTATQQKLKEQNAELTRARQVAEAASDAKDNFLAALSHELRTPLTPVLMTAESLEADPELPSQFTEEVRLIRRNIELEARLIDDLLDLTRIVRGKIELKPERVDVYSMLNSAIEICRVDIEGKQQHLKKDLEAGQAAVWADPIRVQQILWNLLRNAVKFTRAGGDISIRSESQDGQVKISISDTGIGIEPEALAKIFSPFEQTNPHITRQFGGLGLGLAISKRLAELHGGTIVASSAGQDRGATFTLILPQVVPGPQNVPHAPSSAMPAAQSARRLSILLVEDHEDTRRSMTRLLGRHHAVHAVPSMAAALIAAEKQKFDLLISDLGLPDGSGLDLMRELRRLHGLRGICLSGFGMEEDVTRSAEAGFSHHLTKPIDLGRLEAAIQSTAP